MSYRKYLMTDDVPPSELYKTVKLSTNLAEVGTDCISRQAAIDALYSVDEYNSRSVKAIKQLQPIQPEIVRCKDCKYHHKRICPIERYFSLDGFCSRGER